jgi:hypothetical protein
MNDICETWSSRWRALQRDLASGMGEGGAAYSGTTARAVNLQSASVAANSWLGRARLRRVTLTQVRQ